VELNRLSLGEGRWGHASGALLHEESGTLLVADAHLGYGWAQRRRGQLGPVTDGGIVDRLFAAVEELQPREVLFLGDTVHAPKPVEAERDFIEGVLLRLVTKAKVSVVRGNHDRAFVRDFGHLPVAVAEQWRHGDLLGLHGDRLHLELPEAGYYLIGHLHPAINLRDDAGANKRVPAFLVGARATLLPAFSPFAAGFDVSRSMLPVEVRDLLGKHLVYPVTGRRIVELPGARR
jgi:uncharacterized protein